MIREDRGLPPQTTADQWELTRARAPEDVNPDVRDQADRQGWSLFKLGGDFTDIDAELERRGSRADS